MKNLEIVTLIGIISSIHLAFVTCNVKQPPPLKLDWIPFHRAANKSGKDTHPLFTKEEEEARAKNMSQVKDSKGRFLGNLLGGVGGLVGGLLGGGGGGGGPVAGVIEFFAKFTGAVSQFKGISSLVRQGVDLAKLFGLDPKDHAIFIDNRCFKCFVFVKCGKDNLQNTDDFETTPEDGLVLRFRTFPPFDLFDHYKCQAHDLGPPGQRGGIITQDRWSTIDAYGGKAPKAKLILIEIRNDRVVRLVKESDGFLRIEGEERW